MTKEETKQPYIERLAIVETKVDRIDKILEEKVVPCLDEISAYQNKQKGVVAAGLLFITAIGAAVGALLREVWQWFTG